MEEGREVTVLLYLLLSLLSPFSDRQVAGLVSTAPEYLTAETAGDHLIAAVAAGVAHGVDPAVLLSIAHHESRYSARTVTPEPNGRVSCGVMTPVPQHSCSAYELSVVGGYDRGAGHLALWRQYYPGMELTAYAGGGRLVALCSREPDRRECSVTRVFRYRARVISRAILGASRTRSGVDGSDRRLQ